jgi:hypothetical protein
MGKCIVRQLFGGIASSCSTARSHAFDLIGKLQAGPPTGNGLCPLLGVAEQMFTKFVPQYKVLQSFGNFVYQYRVRCQQ